MSISAHVFSFLADVKQGEFPFGAVVLLTPSLEMTCFGISLFMKSKIMGL
jgi:hypothetical protein